MVDRRYGATEAGLPVVRSGVFIFLFFGGLGAVATLASVAVWHPDGFDGLAVGHADEVTLGAVYGTGSLDDFRETDDVTFGGKGVAEGLGEDGGLAERSNSLTIKGFVELAGAIRLLAVAGHEDGEVFEGHPEERFFIN